MSRCKLSIASFIHYLLSLCLCYFFNYDIYLFFTSLCLYDFLYCRFVTSFGVLCVYIYIYIYICVVFLSSVSFFIYVTFVYVLSGYSIIVFCVSFCSFTFRSVPFRFGPLCLLICFVFHSSDSLSSDVLPPFLFLLSNCYVFLCVPSFFLYLSLSPFESSTKAC